MCFWIFKKKKNKEQKNNDEVKVEELEEETIEFEQPAENNSDVELNIEETKDESIEETSKETKKEAKKETLISEKTTKTSSKKVYHVSLRKDDGKWQVKYGGGKKAIKLFDTQAEAIKFAEERANSQEGYISIHKKDGKIRKQDYSKKSEDKKKEEK